MKQYSALERHAAGTCRRLRLLQLPFTFAVLILSAWANNQDIANSGQLDPSFNGTGKTTLSIAPGFDDADAVAAQSDGKLIVAGTIQKGAHAEFLLVRYNTDGSLDNAFGEGGTATALVGISSSAAAVAIQSDGKIVVAGYAAAVDNDRDFALARFNSDGSLDTSFGVGGKVTTAIGSAWEFATAIALQNGKIVVAGYTDSTNGYDFAVVRYDSNGSLDPSFGNNGITITSFVVGEDTASAVLIQGDGKILVAGMTRPSTDDSNFAIARYTSAGILDGTFGTGGKVITSFGSSFDNAFAMAFQRGNAAVADRLIVVGSSVVNNTHDVAVARYHIFQTVQGDPAPGTLDTSFGGDGKVTTDIGGGAEIAKAVTIQGIVNQPRKITIAGNHNPLGGFAGDVMLLRYNQDGSLDNSFDGDGEVITPVGLNSQNEVGGMLLLSGKIIVTGQTENPTADVAIVRYNASDGSLDSTFDLDGKRIDNFGSAFSTADGVAVQGDNKVILAGTDGDNFALARFNENGTVDTSFGSGGIVATDFNQSSVAKSVAVQADGKIVAGGYANSPDAVFALARYEPNGALDTSFGDNGLVRTIVGPKDDRANAIVIQPDNKIVAAGCSKFQDPTGPYYEKLAVVRYTSDGTPDPAFGGGDGIVVIPAIGILNAVALQADGKIVVGGWSLSSDDVELFTIVRLHPNGAVDSALASYIGEGDSECHALKIQTDGKIVAAGFSQSAGSTGEDFTVLRSLGDGTLDSSFGGTGIVTTALSSGADHANGLTLQADGKILAAGFAVGIDSQNDFAVVRYLSNGNVDQNYGDNGHVLVDLSNRNPDAVNGITFDGHGRVVLGGDADGKMGVARLLGDNLEPTAVVSRKVHGGNSFDIDLPLVGPPGIECRSGGASGDHQLIISFPAPVTLTSASVTTGAGSVSNFNVNGAQVTVNLTGVANAQTIAVTLFGVSDGTNTGDVTISMGVLLGDTSGNGSVNASDISQTKSKSGLAVDNTNFRADVTVSNSINASDVSLVKSKSGTALP